MWRLGGIFFLGWAVCAQAVIVRGGDGSANVTATGAGAGWNYVGAVNGASGVYLGDYGGTYWVLTAGHVGEGAFTLGGLTYGVVGSAVTLVDPAGAPVDLKLFQISASPNLPTLELANSPPGIGQSVTMIGYGTNREAAETRYTAAWQETTNPIETTYRGYKWVAGATKRWGTNTVGEAAVQGNTEYLTTDFDRVTGEAQATVGDSGGGVFVTNGGTVTLVGSMGLVSTFATPGGASQPASTSIFGNATYSADISQYRTQILAIVTPVPEPATLALGLLGAALAVRCRARKARAGLR